MERNLLGVRKGAWTEKEDELLRQCIQEQGEGKWHQVPIKAGLKRCRKSCRLRWLNYLKPNIKRGYFSEDEIDLMIRLRKLLGNRWSLIAGRLPGRTANDVKNYWSTRLRRKLTVDIEKDKTLEATKTTIIRPRPRTVSKKLHNLSSESTSLQHIPSEEMFNWPLLSSPPIENDVNWWETLLGDNDSSVERASCSSFQFNEDLFTTFWVEDMAQTKELDTDNYAEAGLTLIGSN